MEQHPAVRPIIDSFLGRLDEVVERCADAIAGISSYGRGDPGLMEDVRGSVRSNVAALSQSLSEGREIKPEELEAIERVGARRAEAGIPLDDVLQAYRSVTHVCWDILAEECRAYRGDALEATIQLAQAVLRYTDQISTTAAEAYARAQRAIVREQEGARREFLADILYGTEASPEEILRRAHAFGYDLSLSYVALVGVCAERDGGNEAAVAAAASSARSDSSQDPIVLQRAEQTIALLAADAFSEVSGTAEKIVAELGFGWRFGLGGPEPGLEGIRRAYLEAREALEIGIALGLQDSVFRFDDLLLYRFLRIEPALVDRFVEQSLGPLIAYDARRKGELVKTIMAFFDADGSVKMAGESLFAHPHTVSYRLKQIERLTGWSLRDPEDKLRLQLALRAYKLVQARKDFDDDE
jgi:DNA-binding PucR family transcriptional regulator